MNDILQYYGIIFSLTLIFLNPIHWTTDWYVCQQHWNIWACYSFWRPLCFAGVAKCRQLGGGPDCIVFCALCITKDLHMLKFGTVVFSLKHPASIYFCTQKCLRCHLCVSPKICVETQIWPLLCLAVWMAPPARWSREHKKALVQWFCDNKL